MDRITDSIHIQTNTDQRKPLFGHISCHIFCFNMISVEYRHVYRMIILTMVRSISRHILYNLLAVTWFGKVILLSINWPILVILLSNIPLYAYFFHRVLDIKILSFPHRAWGLSLQMERPIIYVKYNVLFRYQDDWCRTKNVLLIQLK